MKYEYIEGSIKNRGHIVDESDITLSPTDKERYISLFGFGDDITDWVKYNNTVSGYNGNYYLRTLYFDIDVDNAGISREDNLIEAVQVTRDFIKGLYRELRVHPNNCDIYFSGNKGFHVGLHEKLFGNFTPEERLPERIKALAERIVGESFSERVETVRSTKGNNYKGIDLGIYNKNRIFRTALSKNAKSGYYKVRLTSDELFKLDVEDIIQIAEEPRDIPRGKSLSSIYKNDQLASLYKSTVYDANSSEGIPPTGPIPEKRSSRLFTEPERGDRNNHYYRMATHLFDHTELSTQDISDIVFYFDTRSEDPIGASELKTLLGSAERKTQPNRIKKIKDERTTILDFESLVETWATYHTSDHKKLSTGFAELDSDLKGELINTFGLIAGSAGTLKSYYMLNFMKKNLIDNECKGLLLSMEMGKVQLVDRLLDMFFELEHGVPASSSLTRLVKEDKTETLQSIREARSALSSNLGVVTKSYLTMEDIGQLIEEYIRLNGDIDFVLVDGFANLGGDKNEVERMSQNSSMAKEIAKEYEICVMGIGHTIREASKFERNALKYVRGGQKIEDNMDWSISLSKLIDDTSEPDDPQEMPNLGHIRFWNKRGTGNTINIVYEFNEVNKTMHLSSEEIWKFPTLGKFTKSKGKWNE